MPKTIRPDGSDDFEDDGGTPMWRARQAYNAPRTIWSTPRNKKEAAFDGLRIGLAIGFLAWMVPIGLFLGAILAWLTGL